MARSTLLALAGILAALSARPIAAAEREALVIGNAKYAGSAVLGNPGNDADAIASALKGVGFAVTKEKDLDRRGMRNAIVAFQHRLHKGGLGLFYYAGHGVQVGGENYLVPIGAEMRTEYEAKDDCLAVAGILEAMDEAEANLKVLILDCCRDNPFQRSWKRSSSNKGLASISSYPKGTLIAFSTAPNQTAADGTGQNSPYAEQLVATLRSRPPSGLELIDVFRVASHAVSQRTQQEPWLNFQASIPRYYLW